MASSESIIIPPILKKIYGVNLHKKYRLTSTKVFIGRHPNSHIVIDNPAVSRRHCVISFTEGNWTIRNFSQNGTYINGKCIEDDVVLQCGDIIFLGPPSENPEAFTFDDIPDDKQPQDMDSCSPQSITDMPNFSSEPEVPPLCANLPNPNNLFPERKRWSVSLKRTRELDVPVISPTPVISSNIKTSNSECKKAKEDFQEPESLSNKNVLSPSKFMNDPEIASKMEKLLESEIAKKIDSLKKAHDKLLKDYKSELEKNEHLHEENKNLQDQLEEQKQSSKARLDRLACNICTELALQPVVLNCSHTFCEHCIRQWRKRKAQCPLCRQPIKTSTRVLILDEFIDETLTALSPNEKGKREQLLKEREEAKTPKPKQKFKKRSRRRVRPLITAANPAIVTASQPMRNIEVVDLGESPVYHNRPLPLHIIHELPSDSSDSDDDIQNLEMVIINNNYCYNCGSYGHSADDCM